MNNEELLKLIEEYVATLQPDDTNYGADKNVAELVFDEFKQWLSKRNDHLS